MMTATSSPKATVLSSNGRGLMSDNTGMHIEGIHHIQLAMPAGQEDRARRFYSDLLGIPEVPKPQELVKRGGVWFERVHLRIHLGVDPEFRPARKAHPGLLVDDLPGVIDKLRAADVEVVEAEPLHAFHHVYVSDPFGNRLELMEHVKQGAGATFGSVTPILPVRNLEAACDFYVRVLGFKVNFVGPGRFASVSRGECGLFLSEGDQGNPGVWVWVGVDNVESVLAELKAKECDARHPPTNYSWAYEMQIEDLDGNVLRIGSEPRSDLPPAASWRDMRGQLWKKSESGEWSRQPE
jgi:catechol 2,3-dioxygenase-like lactoylglutathione lyase family enzyme